MDSKIDTICREIARVTGRPFAPTETEDVGGGCINSALVLAGREGRYFVKLNSAARLDMFEAEAAGLAELAGAGAVRVPVPLCTGQADGSAYLVLEYLPLRSAGVAALERLGRELAALHRASHPSFGWVRDNTIGSTAQPNPLHHDWFKFWREARLGFQLDLAARNGAPGTLIGMGERLQDSFPVLFGSYRPVPSLLHGDLWGGNFAMTEQGEPVIFDPAVYYGDREADIAMTELFGGFGPRFYATYAEAWPLDEGYGTRKVLYNLYHVLNHFNLFGGGYASQAETMIGRLLAEIG
jgi:protein-ribulosamine 3-kinase